MRPAALLGFLVLPGCASTPCAPAAPPPRLHLFEECRTIFVPPWPEPAPDDVDRAARRLTDLASEAFEVRQAALDVLGRLGPEFVPFLAQSYARTDDPEVRGRLGALLGRRRIDPEAILGVLGDLESHDRLLDGADMLCALLPGPDAAIDAERRDRRPPEDWWTLRAAFRALLTERRREAITRRFLAAIEKAGMQERLSLTGYAVRYFWQLGGERELRLLEAWLREGKWLGASAIRAIPAIGGPAAEGALERLADDPQRRYWIVFEAADAPGPGPALPVARRILAKTTDPLLLRQGLPLVRHLPPAERIPFLLEAYARLQALAAEKPEEAARCRDPRYAILRALARLPGKEAVPVLARALEDPDEWIRQQGVLGLAARGDPRAELLLKGILDGSDRGRAAFLELQLIDFPALRPGAGTEEGRGLELRWTIPEREPYVYTIYAQRIPLLAGSEMSKVNPPLQKTRVRALTEELLPRGIWDADPRRDLRAWTLGTPAWDEAFLLDVATPFAAGERRAPLGRRLFPSSPRDNSLWGCEIEIVDRVRVVRGDLVEVDHEVRIFRDWRPRTNASYGEIRAWGVGRSLFDRARGLLLSGEWRLAYEETVSGSWAPGGWDVGLETFRIRPRD